MNWIIQSKDGSISEIKYYTAEDGFLAALRDLFGDLRGSSSAPPCLTEGYSMRLPRKGLLSE